MMGHRQVEQAALFYEFSLEKHVPADLLRSIDRFVDLIGRDLASFYRSIGRPSIDPELMIRMLLIGYCFGILSERRLCDACERENSSQNIHHDDHSEFLRGRSSDKRSPASCSKGGAKVAVSHAATPIVCRPIGGAS